MLWRVTTGISAAAAVVSFLFFSVRLSSSGLPEHKQREFRSGKEGWRSVRQTQENYFNGF